MKCRGCDTPIQSDTYCQRCLEEIEALIYAKPFVWPEWVTITCRVLCGVLVILLVMFCFWAIALLTPDTQY